MHLHLHEWIGLETTLDIEAEFTPYRDGEVYYWTLDRVTVRKNGQPCHDRSIKMKALEIAWANASLYSAQVHYYETKTNINLNRGTYVEADFTNR